MKGFQIKIKEPNKDWETIQGRTMEFENRDKATEFCLGLSQFYGREVRISEGNGSASYILYTK